eukprot:79681-Prymnesium_polylepis.1
MHNSTLTHSYVHNAHSQGAPCGGGEPQHPIKKSVRWRGGSRRSSRSGRSSRTMPAPERCPGHLLLQACCLGC